MKKITLFPVILLFLVLSVSAEESTYIGKVTYISGKGYVKASGQDRWAELKTDMDVHNLDSIKTGSRSRCEISFQKKKVIRIDENTDIRITNDMTGSDKVTISRGDIWLSVHLPDMQSAIKLETPSTACSIRGTVYRLTYNENLTIYKCYQGKIEVESLISKEKTLPEKSYPVTENEELVIVIDFEKYKQQERQAYLNYLRETKGHFEQFKEQQKNEFQKMFEKEQAEFQKMDGFFIRHRKFDKEKDMAVNWVKWNMERDLKMMHE